MSRCSKQEGAGLKEEKEKRKKKKAWR